MSEFPEVGTRVHFVFAFRPRYGTVVAHEARPTREGLHFTSTGLPPEDLKMVQVDTGDTEMVPGLPTWNVPLASLGAVAPTLAELIELYAEHWADARGAHGSGYDRLKRDEAKQELDRRYKLAKSDHPWMWDAHLDGMQLSASRERRLIIWAKKEQQEKEAKA